MLCRYFPKVINPLVRHPLGGVIFIGGDRTRTYPIATCRWHVAATSANTGGFLYFRLRRKCKSSPVVSNNTTFQVVLFLLAEIGLEQILSQHASGMLLPPVQPPVASFIFASGENVNRVLLSPSEKSTRMPIKSAFGPFLFYRERSALPGISNPSRYRFSIGIHSSKKRFCRKTGRFNIRCRWVSSSTVSRSFQS